jgi:prepilin-type N-terminal cleavage/methylation domain-containing protein
MRAKGLRPKPKGRAGMTLMELVIALAILAIMAAAGGVAFSTIIDRQETIRTANAEVERAAALRETIRQWVLQGEIFVQRGGVPRGGRGAAQGPIFTMAQGRSGSALSPLNPGLTAAASTGNELTVVTNAPNPLMAAAVRVRLFVDVDPLTPEQGLTMEFQSSTTNASLGLQRKQLDPEIGDLVIEFLDTRTNRWFPSTQAATIEGYAIRLSMVPAEGKAIARVLQMPLTIVYGEPPTMGIQ